MKTIEEFIKENNLTIESEFVPWSKSRNAKENPRLSDYSLNWKATLISHRNILTTDFSAGIAYCPSYTGGKSKDEFELIIAECETGFAHKLRNGFLYRTKKPILPSAIDFLCCLIHDDVLNYSSFEEWASFFGYHTDSRKSEKIYNDCVKRALKLRNGLGEEKLNKLRILFQDY